MAFQVEEFCLFGGWTNTWSYDDEKGNTISTIFDTREEAQNELNFFFQEMEHELKEGNIDDIPDKEDFRIREINHG
jgi:hypothetical protein